MVDCVETETVEANGKVLERFLRLLGKVFWGIYASEMYDTAHLRTRNGSDRNISM
jgi:hypothetical protein